MYANAQYLAPYNVVNGVRCDINGVTSFVPIDPANTDYANLMALVAEGKLTIAPAEGG
jgi:hypothetical protein